MSTPYNPKSTGSKLITPGNTRQGSLGGSDISRVLPRQLSTGTTRGTQTVGYGNAKIDGSNNRITVGDDSGGTVGLGSIPGTDNEVGIFILAPNGKLSMKIVGGTFYAYDPTTGLNTVQMGILPDGTGGIAGANQGFDVADGFTS